MKTVIKDSILTDISDPFEKSESVELLKSAIIAGRATWPEESELKITITIEPEDEKVWVNGCPYCDEDEFKCGYPNTTCTAIEH